MSLVSKNRWTASNATILGIATRNNGVVAGGGSGVVRFLSGIHKGVRDVDVGSVVTRIQTGTSATGGCFKNAVDQIYLGCGANGIVCLEIGFSSEDEDLEETSHSTSLLSSQLSDMHYLGNIFQ
jgi:hypothetical protein